MGIFLVFSFPLEVDIPESKISAIAGSLATWKHKRHHVPKPRHDSCCPTTVEIIEPWGGKNRSGKDFFTKFVVLWKKFENRTQILNVLKARLKLGTMFFS